MISSKSRVPHRAAQNPRPVVQRLPALAASDSAFLRSQRRALKLITGRRDRTDPAAGPVRSMEVAAGDADQVQTISLGLNPPAQAPRKAGPVDFDRLQAQLDERPKRQFPQIDRRMSQCRNSAGRLDQGDCPPGFEPKFINARRAAIAQISAERPHAGWLPGRFGPGIRRRGGGPERRGERLA